ncbi:proline-rich receptor-like protein kinase PERK9 [Salvia divinorum]|uniref:Proline-rich receptor-like protein kinase PERK9 n=1 Tax=Salvia divinorum TaxID=28513 RepID=A0ABD1I389_SALDI
MFWFWTILFLSFAIINNSESKLHKPSAVVVGTVYCDTCFQQNLPKASHYFIAGASVTVECKDARSGMRFRQQVKTDSHGEFKVHLPFPVSKHTTKIRGCSVRLIRSNKPYCAVAASATSSNLHFKSTKDGTHVFSAGFFTFRPLKQPQVCNEKPSITNFNKLSNPSDPAFVPPIQDQPSFGSFLPPLPRLPPLPQLPRLPPLPGIPFLPPAVPRKQAATNVPNLSENQPDTPFPPNPFNLPNILPPNPIQIPPITIPQILPSPLQSVIPPLLPSPSPPPLFNLPPIPGLIPSPPPPPPPVQLPSFPFQPTPGFPGVPPAKVSALSETSSP